MKIRIILFLLLFIWGNIAFPQNQGNFFQKIDSLEKLLLKTTNIDSSRKIQLKIISLQIQVDISNAKKNLEKLDFTPKTPYDSLLKSLWYLQYTNYNYYKVDYDAMDSLLGIAIPFTESISNNEKEDALYKLKMNYGLLMAVYGYRNIQIQKFTELIPLVKKSSNSHKKLLLYLNLGICYIDLKDYEKALIYFYESKNINYNGSYGAHNGLSDLFIATCYYQLDKRDSLTKYVNLAKKNITTDASDSYKIRLLSYEGVVKLYKNDKSAIKKIEKAYSYADSVNEQYELISATIIKADYFAKYNNINRSISLLSELDKSNIRYERDVYLNRLIKYYNQTNNYKLANQVYEKLLDYIDEEKKRVNLKQIEELDFNFRLKDKTTELELLKAENDKNIIVTERNQFLYSTVIVGLLMIVVVIVFRINSDRKRILLDKKQMELLEAKVEKRRQNTIINDMKLLKEIEDRERNRIANDLHDSVGGFLSSIKISIHQFLENPLANLSAKEQWDKVLNYVDESKQELNRIVYNLTPLVVERFGVIEAIKQYCKKISSDRLNVVLQIISFPNNLKTDSEITIYRVIQEILHNVIKHAGANEILVQIQASNKNDLFITIEDNGVGMTEKEVRMDGGLGMKSLYSRVQGLNGQIFIKSEISKGTQVYVFCKPDIRDDEVFG